VYVNIYSTVATVLKCAGIRDTNPLMVDYMDLFTLTTHTHTHTHTQLVMKSKLTSAPRIIMLLACACLAAYVLALCFLTASSDPTTEVAGGGGTSQIPYHRRLNVGTYATLSTEGTEFVYQVPNSNNITGFIIFAHGCGHSALDWWPTTSSCTRCRPLPAELMLVDKAIQANLVAIAVSSPNRKHKCWHMSDKAHVLAVLQHVKGLVSAKIGAGEAIVTQHKDPATVTLSSNTLTTASNNNILPHVNQLPLFVFGVSSGGGIAAAIAEEAALDRSLHVGAVALQISYLHQITVSSALSPILFDYMKKDFRMSMSIRESLVELAAVKVPTHSVVMQHLPLLTALQQYGPYMLPSSSPEQQNGNIISPLLTPQQQQVFVDAMRARELLSVDGYLVEDPRHSHKAWHTVAREALPTIVPALDTLTADVSPISEVMNIAFASHEISAQHVDEMLQWFFSVSKSK
jgi:hypothetical protein